MFHTCTFILETNEHLNRKGLSVGRLMLNFTNTRQYNSHIVTGKHVNDVIASVNCLETVNVQTLLMKV